MRRLPLRLIEAKQDAPNYQKATGAQTCHSCKFASGGYCEKYDFVFEAGFTCDAWQAKK